MGEAEKVTDINAKGFKLSYKAFQNPQGFVDCCRKICTTSEYKTFKSKYRIKRLIDSLQNEMDSYFALRKDLDNVKDQAEYKKKEDELWAMTVDIKWGKLTAEEVDCIPNITPADIFVLEFIADLPE